MSQGHNHHADDHGSNKSYLVGFVLAVILTVIPFWMVMSGSADKQTTVIAIWAFAVVQLLVHLKYFLHLNFTEKGRLNTFAFLFTAVVIVLLVGLSVWIMYAANALMMR